ncbi:hypothetical protein AXG93_2027s1000 [Marchantia polymorpha subsp. ruderalis]|uniref:Uncharacterized protein n=1 Tax=Marchantia polymorpha subsp. ruderalis TaxID=1480154 RepID=A0A176VEK8_MARPO|nr:hypothetical protein AXG93_2027s1000 [Marchantia polymorpha subsp. ruderalis]
MAMMQILRPQRPTYMMTWQVGFLERLLRGDRIHWARIFWTVTRQHIGLLPGGSPSYLSPFLINFYRGMNLLTAEESRAFPLWEVEQEGEETVLANEVNADLESEPQSTPQQRRKRPRGWHDPQPRKKRQVDEASVREVRLQRTALFALRNPDSRARSKMKARRLILDEDSSPERSGTRRKDCSNQEARSAGRVAQGEDGSAKKKSCLEEGRSSPVGKARASRKEKGKAVLTEDIPLKRWDVPRERTQRERPEEEAAEILTVSSDTEEDPVALEEVAAKAVEDVAAAEWKPPKVTSPRTSTDTVILKPGEEPSAEETQSTALGAVEVLSVQNLNNFRKQVPKQCL